MSELAAFVSYSHRDEAFVTALARALESEGRDVWVDEDDIPPGAPWRRELGTAIEAADAFIFVLSPDSVASRECRAELDRAAGIGKRLVALEHRPTERPPPELRDIQWIRGGADDLTRIVDEVCQAIDTDHDHVSAHTLWLSRALRWSDHGRDRSHLLRGRELAAAEEWLATATGREPAPTLVQTDFINAGRRAERTRQRRVISATSVALAIALALAAVALVQRNTAERERRVAEARELAASALLTLSDDPELSLILAERGAGIDANAQVEDALRQALLTSRVRLTLSGHPNQLSGVAYSPDGATIATASQDGTGRLWDAETGKARAVLTGHEQSINGLEFGSDGRWLITYAQDSTARVWDVLTGRPVAVLRDPDEYRVTDATLSPDGRHAATGSFVNGNARIWDVASARTTRVIPAATVNDLEFSPDGRLLVTTHQDNTARLWDVETGAARLVLRGHRGRYVWSAGFSPDGRLLATAGADRTARVWDVATGRVLQVLAGHRAPVLEVRFAPGGKSLLTLAEDRTVRIWSAASGRSLAELAHDADLESAAFSLRGDLAVTTDADGVARVWRSRDGQPVATLRGHRGPVRAAAFGPGTRVVTAGADGTARVWDAGPGSPALVVARRQVLRQTLTQSSPAGRTLVAHDNVWERRTSCLVLDLRNAGEPGRCRAARDREILAVDDTGRRAITGPWTDEGHVAEASTATGRVTRTFAGSDGRQVRDASFGPDGRIALARDDGTAEIWDSESGRRLLATRAADRLATLFGSGPRVTSAAFSPDGTAIVTASDDRSVRIFDAASGRQRHRLEGLPPLVPRIDPIAEALFSPDGTRILGFAAWSDTAIIWDARSGRRTTELIGHTNAITSAQFSPNGAFAVTTDATDARLWDSVSGRLLAVFGRDEPFRGPRFATFVPDGRSIAVLDPLPGFESDGELVLYDCLACRPVGSLADLAASRITRPLSDAERAKYLHE